MEFLEGESLEQRIEKLQKAEGAEPARPADDAEAAARIADQVIEWGLQLAGALDAAHARGIVRRDLKPGNVIVMSSGDVIPARSFLSPAAAIMAALSVDSARLGTNVGISRASPYTLRSTRSRLFAETPPATPTLLA